MRFADRERRPKLLLFAVVCLLAVSVMALGGLCIVGRGDVESFLHRHFGHSNRAVAFYGVNGRLEFLAFEHTILFWLAVAAARKQRTDVVAVLLIGPMLSLALVAFDQDWRDPDWRVILPVCAIGWFVGIVFTLLYWAFRRRAAAAEITPPKG